MAATKKIKKMERIFELALEGRAVINIRQKTPRPTAAAFVQAYPARVLHQMIVAGCLYEYAPDRKKGVIKK